MDQIRIARISAFQAVTTDYIKSYQSKKSLKVVNSGPTTGLKRSLTLT